MRLQFPSRMLYLLHILLSLAEAAPAPRASSNPPLRGTEALVGYSPSEKAVSHTQPDIKYSLLPEQKNSPDIGDYLNFQGVQNPQPIRGSTGSDDPGPRKSHAWNQDTQDLSFRYSSAGQGTTTMTELIVINWRLRAQIMARQSTRNGPWVSLLLWCSN